MNNRNNVVPKPAQHSPIVYVIDDDLAMREALVDLFKSLKMDASGFEHTSDFLKSVDHNRPGCILLDVRLPGLSGLDFQSQLETMGSKIPVVFMTGFGDIPMSVRAMKAGAIDFLTKPFRDQDVLDAVAAAIEKDGVTRRESAASDALHSLLGSLTPREVEVMKAVVKGLMNKQIAYDLGISEITVKLHRGNVMRKMRARSVADLVRMAEAVTLR
jgi:FixJ family two-component response regulator